METIVVIDDDRVFRELLTTVLSLEGYRAVVRTTPEEVVPTVQEEKPALILMDVHIHRQDTLDTLRELKGDEALRNVPIIMTSGMDHAQECMSAGADAFVLKPFRPSEMLDKIVELIQSREQ
jgi:chemosensory pili system protein ChpA (sensor histidine kinase/response regulator)